MSADLEGAVTEICQARGNDRTRLMDVVREVQERFGHVSGQAMECIARCLHCHRVEVDGVVSFYAFLSDRPRGDVVIRLCDDIVDRFQGSEEVAQALSEELGIDFGQTTGDGAFTLERTPCIGMGDQAPAALVNDTVVTSLTPEGARAMVRSLMQDPDPAKLVTAKGDGNNAHPLVNAMVENNVRRKGEVIFAADLPDGVGLEKALSMTPQEVLKIVKAPRLRGRGGAGFPTGMKWEFTRGARGDEKWVLCNADEGEPGTFKDRVLLTEAPDLVFEGMTIGAWAIGASGGIVYLRAEYAYLRAFLEDVLAERRKKGLLGKAVGGKSDFDFDIRIQMGAGAYVCGEETALISSCEGLRGDPKNRPPFPAQKGYLGKPSTVNNVETFACVTRILENGAEWFGSFGTKDSKGTKLLSVSGDCALPGVFEVPFGTPLSKVFAMAGARSPAFAIVGGPSGTFVGPEGFDRIVCYDDLATGGAMMVFSSDRDLLEVVSAYLSFFIEESCGYCTPCRAGNVLMKQRIEALRRGRGEPGDLDSLRDLANVIRSTSRCGLGQTAPNPVLSTLDTFRDAYAALVKEPEAGRQRAFDLAEALVEAETIAGRKSEHAKEGGSS